MGNFATATGALPARVQGVGPEHAGPLHWLWQGLVESRSAEAVLAEHVK